MDTKALATKIAAAASDKKAKDILLLNMEGLSPVTDYYVICSASNTTLEMNALILYIRNINCFVRILEGRPSFAKLLEWASQSMW